MPEERSNAATRYSNMETNWSGVNTMNSPELQHLQKKYSGQQLEIEELRNKLAELSESLPRNRQPESQSVEDQYLVGDEKLKSLQHNLRVFDFSFPIIQEICKRVQLQFENLNATDDDHVYDFVMKELEKKIQCRNLNFQNKVLESPLNTNGNSQAGANLTVFISEFSSGQSSLIYKMANIANRPTILRLETEESFDNHDSLASKMLRADVKTFKKTTELITSLRDITKNDASGDIFIDLKVPSDRPEEVINLIQSLRRSYQKIEVVLVLSSLHQEIVTKKMLQRYRSWIDGVAITHADSSFGMGSLFSSIVQYDRPVFILSTGRKIPNDWKNAEAAYIIKKIFGVNEIANH